MKLRSNGIEFGYKDAVDYSTIQSIIYNWLVAHKAVAEKNKKCPSTMLPNKEEYTDKDLEKGCKKWLATLDKMIYAFRDEEPEYEGRFIEGERHGKEVEKSLTEWQMMPDNEDAWKAYIEAKAEHDKKVGQGRKLFTQYFEHLWV